MNIRKFGLVRIAMILVVILVCSEFFVQQLERSRLAIAEARRSYIAALAQTRSQLASQLQEMTHDPVLISNLSGQLSYSVSRSLDGELYPGTFDFYVIFDENCRPIAKSTVLPMPSGLCQKNASDQWRWYSLDQKPAMFLLKNRLDLEKPFYIGAGRFLSNDWIRSVPGLQSSLQNAGLLSGALTSQALCRWPRMCSEFNNSALVEGRDANGLALASLTSKHKTFSVLRPWLLAAQPLTNPLTIPILFLLCVIFIMEWSRRRFLQSQIRENEASFLEWCQSPLASNVATPYVPALEAAQKSLQSVLRHCADRGSELAKKIETLENDQLDLKDKLTEAQRNLSEHIPYSVLSAHIMRTGASVQQMLSSALELSRDVAGVVDKGFLSSNRKITDLLKTWQNGIAVRGERHYMRSLYEQEGRQEGETLLKSEINRLCSLSEQNGDSAVHTLSLIKSCQQQEEDTLRVIEAWSALASRVSDPTLSFSKIADSAASLVQLERKQRVAFVGKFAPSLILNMPVSTVLSTLLLIFIAMKDGLRDVEADEILVYQAHKRQKQDEHVFAFSITNERGKVLTCHPTEVPLQRVADMLRPWGLQCQVIRRPESGAYVILRVKASLLIGATDSLASVELDNSRGIDPVVI